MSLGLYETSQRRRRQRRWALVRFLLVVSTLVGVAWFSYAAGKQLALAEVEALRQQLGEARQQAADVLVENARLLAEVQVAQQQRGEWEARYRRDVPQGEFAEVVGLARSKLEAGVPLDRVRFVLGTVSRQRECANNPTTKRFLVRTPIYQGANDTVVFADGILTVSATGESARDAGGNPEAWFDSAESVMIEVTEIGGKISRFQGVLPLHFSIVQGESEHLFTARPAERRGFITITEDRCAYP